MRGFLHDMWAATRRETERIFCQPVYAVLMVVLPLVSFVLFALLFGRGAARDMPVAVCDDDRTPLSRELVRMIDATPSVRVAFEVQSMAEGERLVREGSAYGVVLIPDRFEKRILANVPVPVENYVSGTNISVNGLLHKDIQTAVTTFSAGVQMQLLIRQGLTERQAMAQLMPVRFDSHVLFNPYLHYGYYLLPSFLPMMLLVFTIMSIVLAVGTELKRATAREWLATAGDRMGAAIVGKTMPHFIAMYLLSCIMFAVLFGVSGVPLNGSLGVLLVANALFVAAYQSIGICIVAMLSNLRLSLSIAGGYSVLAFTYSGFTFPVMAMWPAVRVFSLVFPYTFYANICVDQMLRGAPALVSLPDLCGMALFIVLPFLCLKRLRRLCTEESYWGRL